MSNKEPKMKAPYKAGYKGPPCTTPGCKYAVSHPHPTHKCKRACHIRYLAAKEDLYHYVTGFLACTPELHALRNRQIWQNVLYHYRTGHYLFEPGKFVGKMIGMISPCPHGSEEADDHTPPTIAELNKLRNPDNRADLMEWIQRATSSLDKAAVA
jgi:hypothetical protein